MSEPFEPSDQMRDFMAFQAYQRKQAEDQVAEFNAHAESTNTEISQFIADLPIKQLETLRKLVVGMTTDASRSLVYGLITGRMVYAEGLSWDGRDINEEAAKLASRGAEDMMDEQRQAAAYMSDAELDALDSLPDEGPSCAYCDQPIVTAHLRADGPNACPTCRAYAMTKWNIDYDEHTRTLHCKGCGIPLVSIEDRAMREPGVEGCTSCQMKVKHG